MAEYKGNDGDFMRIRALQNQREQEKKDLQSKLSKLQEESRRGVVSINQKFANVSDTIEEQLKAETIGLVSLEDFRRKRINIEAESKNANEKKDTSEKKQRGSKIQKNKLSFADEEEEVDGEQEEQVEEEKASKKKKISKNPDVETSFLPDKEREEQEQKERLELARLWKEEQERIKNEDVEITYSYWDGTGHRKSAVVKKGYTIAHFLEKIRTEWKELRGVSVDNLMFVKEDIIIPHHYSFYDLILMKARGKSGPLFQFDVREDVRLVNDASIEKEETHAGKVVERRWYERNKHIFPANRWEVFDPSMKRDDKYTAK